MKKPSPVEGFLGCERMQSPDLCKNGAEFASTPVMWEEDTRKAKEAKVF